MIASVAISKKWKKKKKKTLQGTDFKWLGLFFLTIFFVFITKELGFFGFSNVNKFD
jgi:hypothetical protein